VVVVQPDNISSAIATVTAASSASGADDGHQLLDRFRFQVAAPGHCNALGMQHRFFLYRAISRKNFA
jgi:hypothetical protein